jgi:hypothetical protein
MKSVDDVSAGGGVKLFGRAIVIFINHIMCRAIAVVTMNDKGVFYNLSHDF